ncbi:DEP domain-containing protein 1B-like [Lytechinus variegatus]|uniref:DEP domain-containing protein 1B-like n=1 Tax=Lytechinus variegatus TaxID=7654 RepID=UPI001BB1B7AB|nr:DEP domain-containing protein 1B-like [Lytechinus variegatus]
MEKPKATIGPFRATKLWNSIVSDFRAGIPLKRHRWRMRYYDNCFTSTEAADWLHDYLCNSENFGPWVMRTQVILLLDKFVQSKIIEEVKASKGDGTEKASFEDNGHLYKFLPVSPMKKLRSALASRSSIQSLSPSPKPRKTVPRTGGATTAANPAPRRLTMRDTNIDPNARPSGRPNGQGWAEGHSTRPLALRDTKVNVQIHNENVNRVKEVPRCTLVARPLTREQVEEVWKSATLNRLQRLLWLSTLDGLLDDSVIIPSDIIHNCTHINKNGVVQLINKENDLPHWVLSAMRCLANWPNKIDSELPSYPGFERDVFKTISNYFQSLPEPLITYSRYDLVAEAFVSMECRDRGIIPGQEGVTVFTGVHGGLTSFQSVETLMLNMTMGGQHSSTNTPNMERKNPQARKSRAVRRSTSFGLVDGMLRNETPHLPPKQNKRPRTGLNKQFGSVDVIGSTCNNDMPQGNLNYHHGRAARSNPQRVSNKDDDYGFANMPPAPPPRHLVAEVSSVSDQSQYDKTQSISPDLVPRKCSSLTNIQDAGKRGIATRSRTGGLFASKRFGSATELFNKLVKKKSPSQAGLNDEVNRPTEKPAKMSKENVMSSHQIISPGIAPPPSYPVYTSSPIEPVTTQGFHYSTQNITSDTQHHPNRISPPYPAPLRATLSYSEIPTHQSLMTLPTQSSITPIMGSMHSRRSTSDIPTSTPYENLEPTSHKILQRHGSVASISSLYLSEDKSYCQEALRLCLLLLPAAQRRALHLLLRLMSKMEHNKELSLCTSMSTRELLLETFTRSILCCVEEVDLDECLAKKIVAYLLDNHTTLFNIPQELRTDIEERLTYLKRSQIKYEADVENIQPTGFCAQVSLEEYEKQKTASSQQAIEDLLDNIITDRQMSAKDKKKKLKLFQKAYPDIYHRRLPTSASEAELFPAKPKIKQPMLNVKRSLSRLKPIR